MNLEPLLVSAFVLSILLAAIRPSNGTIFALCYIAACAFVLTLLDAISVTNSHHGLDHISLVIINLAAVYCSRVTYIIRAQLALIALSTSHGAISIVADSFGVGILLSSYALIEAAIGFMIVITGGVNAFRCNNRSVKNINWHRRASDSGSRGLRKACK